MNDVSPTGRDPMERFLEERVSRRRLLKIAAGAGVVGVGVEALGDLTTATAKTISTRSVMKPADGLVVQTYPSDFHATAEALKTYQQQYGVSASTITIPGDYYSITETRFLSGHPPFDTLDQDPGFMGKYYGNGWVVDLEGLPGVDKLKKDMFPAARKACMAPNGKLYALPYYTNIIVLFYNERLLKKYHLTPATTWDELYAQGVKMKKAGFSSPIVPVWTTKFDLTHAIFICDCISRGMHSQFDEHLNPLWDKNPIALQVLEYWRKLQDTHLVPADALTIDHHQSSSIMQAGQGVYFWFNSYELANLNKAGTSKEAGHIRAAMMPDTHYTSTFTAVTYQSKTHTREEAWPLTSFIAGYDKNGHIAGPVLISAVGVGSLPGYKSALSDPRVRSAWSSWSNSHDLEIFSQQLGRAVGEGPVLNTSWYPQYNDFMAKTLSQYLAGEISAKAALKTGADYVRSLKK